MPTLTLSYNDQELHTYPVSAERLLKIGRSDQNDIIIDEAAVSSVHAEVEFDHDGFYLTDIQSKNGTFIDGELIISRKLKNGNVITIGTYSLLFKYDVSENFREEADSISQATMMLDTSIHRSKLAKSLSEIGEEKETVKSRGMITFLDGSREPFAIDKPLVKIGKEPGCDIVVKGLFIGKAAAEIRQSKENFYIRPSIEKSRLKVNYKTVKEETILKDFDVIEVGAAKMQFYLSMP
ncbi:MAG: FHA domain-containing protein [Desulfobacteraceae bacterium]|nr:MAG: FHA domain-containing protein [Desulfobacteraceae bacterium]